MILATLAITWWTHRMIIQHIEASRMEVTARTLECRLALFKASTVSMFPSELTILSEMPAVFVFSRHRDF